MRALPPSATAPTLPLTTQATFQSLFAELVPLMHAYATCPATVACVHEAWGNLERARRWMTEEQLASGLAPPPGPLPEDLSARVWLLLGLLHNQAKRPTSDASEARRAPLVIGYLQQAMVLVQHGLWAAHASPEPQGAPT